MALKVNDRSNFCRCCGRKTTKYTYGTYCLASTCIAMGHQSRNYCEHDGKEISADSKCSHCHRPPLGNR